MEKTIYTRDYGVFLACLRQARVAAGLTQEQLAERIGCTQSFVSKCERGERRVDMIELRTFCNAMGVTLPSFVEQLEAALLARER